MSSIQNTAPSVYIGGEVMVLTGNSGGPVSPSSPSGNINIIGGIGITSVGDPSTNTITLNATDAFIAYKKAAAIPSSNF